MRNNSRNHVLHIDNVLELLQEPLVNASQLPDLVNRVAVFHGIGNCENTFVRWIRQFVIDRLA